LQAALPRPIDPQLAHYLQRRSYNKALEFLEQLQRRFYRSPNLSAASGVCGSLNQPDAAAFSQQ
jgi:hypothetical protein